MGNRKLNDRIVKCFTGICLFLVSMTGYAQFPSELWHEGKIVLVNSDTIKGNIKYDFDQDIIQITNKQGTEAYTAKKVLYFDFLDETSHQHRQFYALPFFKTTEYKTPIFFEVLFEGKMTLLAREFVTMKNVSYGAPGISGSTYSREVLSYKYYFLNNQGGIVRFQNNKRHLYQVLKKKENEIKQYTKRNRLRYDNKSDMILLMEYYNMLINPQKI